VGLAGGDATGGLGRIDRAAAAVVHDRLLGRHLRLAHAVERLGSAEARVGVALGH